MKTFYASVKLTLAFCVILFVGYALVLAGVAWAVTPNNGQAQTVQVGDRIVGCTSVGQSFTKIEYFWGRPSAVDFNGAGSGGSNKGVTNPEYLASVNERIDDFLLAHPYLERKDLPSDLVTASGSGLDPHISPEAAAVQIRRVAEARNMNIDRVAEIVTQNTVEPLFGAPYINLLQLNIALDNEKNS